MKINNRGSLIIGLGIVVLVMVIIGMAFMGVKQLFPSKKLTLEEASSEDNLALLSANCPDTELTAMKFDIKNSDNETGSEGIDQTVYFYKVVDGAMQKVLTITDTTSPSSSNLDCGYHYIAMPISTSGAGGDASFMKSITSQDGDVELINGWVEFDTTGAGEVIEVTASEHATLECRAKNNIDGELMYNTQDGDSSKVDWETDGITWTSTTDNATAYTETDGIDMTYNCRAVEVNTNYQDRGVLVLLEYPVATWEVPAVSVDGKTLSNIKGTSALTEFEAIAYTDYEYIYLIPKSLSIRDEPNGFDLRVGTVLKAGVSSSSADPEVDLAPRGAYLSTKNGVDVLVGAVNDASSPAQVHTLFDSLIDVT